MFAFRNKKMFNQNTLKNDLIVNTIAERYEKARIEKILKDFILKKGFNSLNKIKNVEDLLDEYRNDAMLVNFRFDNELNTGKDTIQKFHTKISKNI